MNDTTHTITISFDGTTYKVRVSPMPKPFDFDLDRRDRHFAMSYARSLSRQRGWRLDDQTGEAGA